jgi:hypothetical protein
VNPCKVVVHEVKGIRLRRAILFCLQSEPGVLKAWR